MEIGKALIANASEGFEEDEDEDEDEDEESL